MGLKEQNTSVIITPGAVELNATFQLQKPTKRRHLNQSASKETPTKPVSRRGHHLNQSAKEETT